MRISKTQIQRIKEMRKAIKEGEATKPLPRNKRRSRRLRMAKAYRTVMQEMSAKPPLKLIKRWAKAQKAKKFKPVGKYNFVPGRFGMSSKRAAEYNRLVGIFRFGMAWK